LGKLNIWRRLREAEEKVCQLEDRVTLYEAIVTELCEEHVDTAEMLLKLSTLVGRLAEASMRSSEASRSVVDTLRAVDLTLRNGLTEAEDR